MSSQPQESVNLVGQTLFGEYTITRKLGEGGMGAVYLATQNQIDQQIAIKVLHDRSAKNDELVKRFNREAKAVSMLAHPNIIRVFIFGRTEEGLIYLAMEFVKGQDLRNALNASGPLEELRAIKILKQTLSALSEAHGLGIIHRDLKPDNILLITDYRGQKDFVKVLDFGIAKIKDPAGGPEQQLTQAGVVYGTPEYLSPEQAQALELDQRTDLYSLGCILYEMMVGAPPFKAPTAVAILMAHVNQPPIPPSQRASLPISPEMERIIMRALAKDPDTRYQTALEFLDDLLKREQQLIDSGHSIEQLIIPGQEATKVYIPSAEQIEQARTLMTAPPTAAMNAAAAMTSNQAPYTGSQAPYMPPTQQSASVLNSPTLAAPAVGPAGTPVANDKRQKKILTILFVMLGVLLVIVAGLVFVVLQKS